MSATDDLEKHKINSELYDALMMREDEKKVIELCRKVPDHALHIFTIHDDTVLHMATHTKKSELVLKLLDELPDMYLDKMTRQNQAGNTILHETATSNHALPVADKVLRKAPGLLGMRNNNGESALFRSARYGKAEIFSFLAGKISGYDQASKMSFLQRTDKTTVLHMSILAEHYVKRSCSLAFREKIKKEEEKYKAAIELAEFLIKRDTSWELSFTIQDQSRPRIHKYGGSSGASNVSGGEVVGGGGGVESAESALFLATKSGCIEMVKRILKVYPQAIEYIDDEGRNILHLAIKYRQLEIFEYVKHMEAPMKRFVRKIDNNGNTILHMTGIKRKDYVPEKMEGPALVLQEELLWYERVKEVMESMPHFMTHQNNMRLTAEGLFALANNDLRLLSIEWLKHTVEGCSVVAVLIATVAFAAIYTVPGGINESTGKPVLINHPFFAVFTVTDVLSLTFSLTSVVTFLSILSSPFRLQDFKHSLPDKLMVGFTFLFLSVVMMMVAFAATILLMIKNKESWTKIMLYTFSFVPVGIFALSYFPVYIRKSMERAGNYLCNKLKQLIPQSLLALLKHICCFSIRARAPITSSSIP
ncbi:hypothetical protein JRO89_XS10G0162800 [Xanthoceras sorbifolium]|uniref:PGG domain-containing protein n=1 Tax=Xanthoceras sorbifolium TaxID=99658 RepID=A0ABQ8HIZ3_9ROSI|nr:hypothetical protein JRO89_XS10G0162800 [Xanthoceras sorbifolium]